MFLPLPDNIVKSPSVASIWVLLAPLTLYGIDWQHKRVFKNPFTITWSPLDSHLSSESVPSWYSRSITNLVPFSDLFTLSSILISFFLLGLFFFFWPRYYFQTATLHLHSYPPSLTTPPSQRLIGYPS